MTATEDLPVGSEQPAASETEAAPAAPAETGDGASGVPFGRNPLHFGIEVDEEWPDDVPKDQDDTHWRFENDTKGAKRAERKIAACWMLTLAASIALAYVYVTGAQNQAAGACWAAAFLGLGAGMILWARDLMPGHDVIASRGHHHISPEPDRIAVAESFSRGTDAMARRPFLLKLLGAVGGVFGVAVLFPLASLGPRPHNDLYLTPWAKNVRAVDEDGNPVRPEDLPANGILTVFPEGNVDDALGPTLLINVGAADFEIPAAKVDWTIPSPAGQIVAFSKICTHAGCPASLYNVLTHQLVCPCHQSTFDVLLDCKPVFGPAPRPLPQLAITTNVDGYIVAQGPYNEPVGPGFWSRGSRT